MFDKTNADSNLAISNICLMSVRINDLANPSLSVLFLNRATNQTQKALSRLSSGSRIVETSADAAGSAVAMKMQAAVNRCDATKTSLKNADSFLQTQASALDALAKGVTRLIELKTLSLDATKNVSDIANYSAEFSQVRSALLTISKMQFNGVDLFSHTGVDTYLDLCSDENGQQQVRLTQYALGADVTNWLSDTATFSFVAGSFTWKQAKFDAEQKGGHLATFASQQEWDQARLELGSDFGRDLWLGGTNPEVTPSNSGTWSWVTGEDFVFNKWSSSLRVGSPDRFSDSMRKWPSTFGEPDLWDDAPFTYPNTAGYILERPAKHLTTIQAGNLDATLQYISNCLAKNGAEAMAVNFSAENISAKSVNFESSKSKIEDADVAKEVQDLSKSQILAQISSLMVKQSTDAQKQILKLIDQRLSSL